MLKRRRIKLILLSFRALWISNRRSRDDLILVMSMEKGVWKVILGVLHGRCLGFCIKVHMVGPVGYMCHDHTPKAPTTMITPKARHFKVPKFHHVEVLIGVFYEENLGKLDHLLLMEHTMSVRKQKHGSSEWRDISKSMINQRRRNLKFPFLV